MDNVVLEMAGNRSDLSRHLSYEMASAAVLLCLSIKSTDTSAFVNKTEGLNGMFLALKIDRL